MGQHQITHDATPCEEQISIDLSLYDAAIVRTTHLPETAISPDFPTEAVETRLPVSTLAFPHQFITHLSVEIPRSTKDLNLLD